MKYLLFATLLAGAEPPNAGPFDSLEACNAAARTYVKENTETIDFTVGLVLKCTPVESSE